MRRRTFLTSLPLAASALASCSRAPAERTKLRVAMNPYLTSSPFYVGLEKGHFADAGFDIELSTDSRSEESIPLLAGGKLDVMFNSTSAALFNAVLAGARLRVVAARQAASPTCDPIQIVYVRRNDFPDGVTDMRSLRGKRIAARQLFSEFALDQYLKASGMTRGDVQHLQMAYNESLAGLQGGSLDAILSPTELFLAERNLPFTSGPNLGQVLPGFQFSFIVFGPALLDGDVRRGARFLQAYFKGANEYVSGTTPQFLEDFAKTGGLRPETVRGICRNTIVPDGHMDRRSFEQVLEWARANKYSEATDPISVIDERFLEAIAKGDV